MHFFAKIAIVAVVATTAYTATSNMALADRVGTHVGTVGTTVMLPPEQLNMALADRGGTVGLIQM